MSGELDVTVDESGKGKVRYRETEDWYMIGNFDAEPPRTWSGVAELVTAIEAAAGERDAAGNTIPFEAPPAGSAGTPQAGDSAPPTAENPQTAAESAQRPVQAAPATPADSAAPGPAADVAGSAPESPTAEPPKAAPPNDSGSA